MERHGIPTAQYGRSPTPPRRTPTSTTHGAPIVVKADGLAAGKGVVVATTRRRSARGDRRDARRQRAGRRRRARRHRGVPGRRGGELHRHGRRPQRAAARVDAGPQAPARRRHGSEHRRHGRLFAGARRHAGAARAHHARDHPADRQRHGRRRHPLHRLPLRRPDDRRRRQPEGARIQLPPGRPGDAADHDAPEVRSRRARRSTRSTARSTRSKPSGTGAPRSASCSPRTAIRTARARATRSTGLDRATRERIRTARCSTPAPRSNDGERRRHRRPRAVRHRARRFGASRRSARLRGDRRDPLRRHAVSRTTSAIARSRAHG